MTDSHATHDPQYVQHLEADRQAVRTERDRSIRAEQERVDRIVASLAKSQAAHR